MGDTVADKHVELVLVVLDPENHGHRLTNLHDSGDLARPGPLAHLDLHPALKVVSEEVCRHGIDHVDLEWPEGDGLLVVVVPGAPQLARLVPYLLDQWVVLDDHCVLNIAAGGVWLPVCLGVARAGHAAGVQEDLEAGGDGARAGGQVDTVGIAVEALAEDHPVEGTVKLYVHPYTCLLALDLGICQCQFEGNFKGVGNLDILDLWLVSIGALGRPNVIVLGSLALEPS